AVLVWALHSFPTRRSSDLVGGAIIKAEKVAEATRTIKKAMKDRKSIPTGLFKKYTDADVAEAFRKISTPNLADAMQKRGVVTGRSEEHTSELESRVDLVCR